MSTTPTPFTAASLAEALRQCLAATAQDRCLADVIEAVEDVRESAETVLAVARHLQDEMDVELGSVVFGGWAGDVLEQVPDTVPAAWLGTKGTQGGLA